MTRVAGAFDLDVWPRGADVRPSEHDSILGEDLGAILIGCFSNEVATNVAGERKWVLKASIRQILRKRCTAFYCALNENIPRKPMPTSRNGSLGTACLLRNDFVMHHCSRGCSCVCRLFSRVRIRRCSRPPSAWSCGWVFVSSLPLFERWCRRSASCRMAGDHRGGGGTHNIRRGGARRRR